MSLSASIPLLLKTGAAATLSDRRPIGGRSDAGQAEAESNVFGTAETQEESEFGVVGEGHKASPNDGQEQKQDRGEGGPTQVLCVPEIAARDTEESLGIQVRSDNNVHTTIVWGEG